MVALIQLKNTGEDAQTVASKYLSPKVVMHADPAGAFYAQDKVGVDAFMKAPQQYGSTYSFSRHLIASAKTTPKDNWAFAWWFDEGVEVTEAWRDKVPHPDARSNIMGRWDGTADCMRGEPIACVWTLPPPIPHYYRVVGGQRR